MSSKRFTCATTKSASPALLLLPVWGSCVRHECGLCKNNPKAIAASPTSYRRLIKIAPCCVNPQHGCCGKFTTFIIPTFGINAVDARKICQCSRSDTWRRTKPTRNQTR